MDWGSFVKGFAVAYVVSGLLLVVARALQEEDERARKLRRLWIALASAEEGEPDKKPGLRGRGAAIEEFRQHQARGVLGGAAQPVRERTAVDEFLGELCFRKGLWLEE